MDIPDLTGVWNGLGDNLNGIPNQIANNGLSIEAIPSRDLHSGLLIATFPRNTNRPQNNEQAERAAACSGALDPTDLFTSRNTGRWSTTSTTTPTKEDPSNNCMPAGIPRGGIPSCIGQQPTHLMFVYPGQGGLIATQTISPHDSAGRPPARRCRSSMERIPAKPSHTGRATRSSLIRGVQHQHLVRSDWRLLPQWLCTSSSASVAGEHPHVDGDGQRPRRAAGTVDDDTSCSAAESPTERSLPESLPCGERDLQGTWTRT